jgi:hypothetical protein
VLLLASPAQSSSGLRPAELKTIFYCPNSWDSPNLEGQVPVFISPKTGWHRYTSVHCVPFPSPFTTRRATVEVFYPASTRELKKEFLLNPVSELISYPTGRISSLCYKCCFGNHSLCTVKTTRNT